MKTWTRERVEAEFRKNPPVMVPLPVESPGVANVVAALQAAVTTTLRLIHEVMDEARREAAELAQTAIVQHAAVCPHPCIEDYQVAVRDAILARSEVPR